VANFEWLLVEGADLAVPASPRFVAADETWQAIIERVPVASTLHVFLNDIRVHRDLRAEPMNHRPADYLTGQVTIAGRSDIDLLDGTLAPATPENNLLYRVPGGLPIFTFKAGTRYHSAGYTLDPGRVEFTFKAGTRYHSAGYTLDPGRVERLLEGEVPAVLRPLVDPNLEQSCLVTSPGDPLMRTLAGGLFNPRLTGPLRRLMMEGVVLQLVAVQAAAAAEQPLSRERGGLTARERTAVEEARQRLLADMRNPPALGDLADAVGLSEKRLNSGFRQMFGATAFETLRNQQPEHARQALEEGAASLKEVSFRVGYTHVSNFVHAFRARYNAAPRQYVGRGRG
jgi:AraC-like DNA-binding protein